MEVFLGCLNDHVVVLGIRFAPWKCKILQNDCIGSKPYLVLAREQPGEVDRFSCISFGDRI